jgi:hypothetical protein
MHDCMFVFGNRLRRVIERLCTWRTRLTPLLTSDIAIPRRLTTRARTLTTEAASRRYSPDSIEPWDYFLPKHSDNSLETHLKYGRGSFKELLLRQNGRARTISPVHLS